MLNEEGFLLIDKPKDLTSFKTIELIKKKFKLKKIGHCGTLDPISTGLIIAVIGKATKSSSIFLNASKEYWTKMQLGIATDSYDITGKIIKKEKYEHIKNEEITDCLNSFIGEQEQTPPMYSALKFKGKKLYQLARQNIQVPIQPRKINIHSLEIIKISLPYIEFCAKVSKGTYLRSLCNDIGEKLNSAATMVALERLKIAHLELSNAYSLDSILKDYSKEEFLELLIPIEHIKSQIND